jgi:cell division protein FtsW (lipid II flippase)
MASMVQNVLSRLSEWEAAVRTALAPLSAFGDAIIFVTRFIFPLLVLTIFLRCLWPLLSGGRRPRPWAVLVMQNGARFPLVHWENSVGRSKNSDILLDIPSVSRTHAVITRKNDGWYITDMDSHGGVTVNGQACDGFASVCDGDSIGIGGVQLTMFPAEGGRDEERGKKLFWASRAAAVARNLKPGVTLLFILLFQLTALASFSLTAGESFTLLVPAAYTVFIALECIYFFFTRGRGKRYIEPELLAFFLCGVGLFVSAVHPMEMLKQTGAVLAGVVLFLFLSFFLNNLERARTARYVFAASAVALLALNLILARTRFGARNWISIGPISIQPSEFVKVAFVFAGASTLDKLLSRRNLLLFMGFSGVCVMALALMRDFGAAAIFFLGFLVMAYMRSGDARVLGATAAVTGVGAVLVVTFMPYIASRFSAWRHVWELAATSGYQQTRTMIYTASGGLLGVGIGKGYLRTVAAADTDLVFGVLAEEWGLVVALICALAPLLLAIFAAMSAKAARSAFYSIAACGAAVILLAQTALNVFGSLDILPLTGVTLPFISNGGSSMVACWGLLACIKSIDERHRAVS